jgi:hypothetical protein
MDKIKLNATLPAFRLTQKTKEKVKQIIRNNPDLYENEAHFCRVAIIREIRRSSIK